MPRELRDLTNMARIKSSSSGPKTINSFLLFLGLHGEGSTKGNKGQGAARRRLKFLGTVFMGLACLLGVVTQYFINLEITRWSLATGESGHTSAPAPTTPIAPVAI